MKNLNCLENFNQASFVCSMFLLLLLCTCLLLSTRCVDDTALMLMTLLLKIQFSLLTLQMEGLSNGINSKNNDLNHLVFLLKNKNNQSFALINLIIQNFHGAWKKET